MAEPLLLDTHVWYWLAEGKVNRVSRTLPRMVERAVKNGRAFVSAMSAWELAMLVHKGRLVLATGIVDWIGASREPPGVRIVDVTAAIAVDGASLPGVLHGDPADRIIVATARSLGATIVTCDERIVTYGDDGNVRVIDGRL